MTSSVEICFTKNIGDPQRREKPMSLPVGGEAVPQGSGPAALLHIAPRRIGEATEALSPEGFAALLAGLAPEPAPSAGAALPAMEPPSIPAPSGALPWDAFAAAAEETARLASSFQWAPPSWVGAGPEMGSASFAMQVQAQAEGALAAGSLPAADSASLPDPSLMPAVPAEEPVAAAVAEILPASVGSGRAPVLPASQQPLGAVTGESVEPAAAPALQEMPVSPKPEAVARPASGAASLLGEAQDTSWPASLTTEEEAAILSVVSR